MVTVNGVHNILQPSSLAVGILVLAGRMAPPASNRISARLERVGPSDLVGYAATTTTRPLHAPVINIVGRTLLQERVATASGAVSSGEGQAGRFLGW